LKENYKNAYAEYGAGSGGELKEKGLFPPKMASYGSSSRMIYRLCKDIADFHFEYKLPTKIGGVANLDGFAEKDNSYIFVEAKCREPYGKKAHLIESKYKELYSYINNSGCNLKIKTIDNGAKIEVAFSVNECEILRFDIKQMICHLLGIAVKLLNMPTDKKVSFVFLCYNPKLIEILDEKKKKAVYETYDQMCDECSKIDFKALFEVIAKYLHQEMNVGYATKAEIDTMISNFSFSLCDQDSMLSIF